jgi:hypothetical protein
MPVPTSERFRFVVLLIILSCCPGCQRSTQLKVEAGNPLKFKASGPGTFDDFEITGPDKVEGQSGRSLPPRKVYWQIRLLDTAKDLRLDDLAPITYGTVPSGFVQVEPKTGQFPPPLIEGDLYNAGLRTKNAEGVSMFFALRDGKVLAEGN